MMSCPGKHPLFTLPTVPFRLVANLTLRLCVVNNLVAGHLSMEFLKPKGVGGAAKLKQQLLTVGDAAGNLHVYDVPQNLWRPLTNERILMSSFLDREIKVTLATSSIDLSG